MKWYISTIKFILIFLLLMFPLSCKKNVPSTKPRYTSLTQSVYASLIIKPRQEYKVFSSVNGIILELKIAEGDIVKKDQVLAIIKNENLNINTESARLNLQLAMTNLTGKAAILKSIEEEIVAVKLKLTSDSINYFRQKSLWEQNIGSKNSVEITKLEFDLAKSQLDQLNQKHLNTKNELDTKVKQNQLHLLSAIKTAEDFTIRSRMKGRVYILHKNEGELIQPQQPLAVIGIADSFLIEMQIDESDITQIRIGQKTILNLDAYSDQIFEARISKIFPQKNEQTQTFTAQAIFTTPPEILYPGLSGEANIIIKFEEKVLNIPRMYLSERNTVFTENREIKVTTGIHNMEYIEIKEGIDTTITIIKPKEVD